MSSIPLPALQIKQQPDVMQQFGQAMQLKQLLTANQVGQIQLQQAQQDQHDRETIMQAFKDNAGDLDKTIQQAAKTGVSPKALMGLQASALDMKTKAATLTKDQLDNLAKQNDNAAGLAQAVINAPPDKKQEVYAQGRQALLANPQAYGVTDPSHVPPEQYPGDDAMAQQLALHQGGKLQVDQEMKRREVAAQETQAAARKTQADVAQQKLGALSPDQVTAANAQISARISAIGGDKSLLDAFSVKQGASRQDLEDTSKSLERIEVAWAARQQRQATAGNRADTRSDKSYQFNSGQLEKVAAPIDQAISRMSRLRDTLAQNSPQADALVAPELLTVMAGGAGSGLRMNEAEISRIVGGKDKWQQLQSAINQWQLNPNKPFLITPEQRKQIGNLIDAVDSKLKAKQTAIDQGREALINSDDPGEHRKIVASVRSTMSAIDQGQAAPAGGQQPASQSKPQTPANQPKSGFDWSSHPVVNQ